MVGEDPPSPFKASATEGYGGTSRGEGDIAVTWDVRKTCLTQRRKDRKEKPMWGLYKEIRAFTTAPPSSGGSTSLRQGFDPAGRVSRGKIWAWVLLETRNQKLETPTHMGHGSWVYTHRHG